MVALDDFIGHWRFDRVIRHDDGLVACLDGQAVWQPAPHGAVVEERGHLLLPGHAPLPAERRYLWDETLAVRFADGRFFHAVPAGGGRAEHLCPPDRYVVTYDFARWPDWTCRWRVDGPRKAYAMTTRFFCAAA